MLDPLYTFVGWLLPGDLGGMLFLQRALVAGIFLATAAGILGVGVVGHRLSYFSNAVSHSSFTGVAVGLLSGISPYLTLVAFAVLVGLAITALRRRGSLATDTVVGVVFATVMALGIALLSAYRGLGRELSVYIYGDILTLTDTEVLLTLVCLLAAVIFAALFFNKLALTAVSPAVARASGVRVAALEYAHAALIAAVVAVAVRAVGILFVTALLILPAAAARNLARRQGTMFWWAAGLGALSAVGGILASVVLNTATAASIILVGAVLFGVSLVIARLRRVGVRRE
ncbi:MAG: metal ABC transporter permease [Candidatus Coatesbacteria bacterium]|nr:metal ABC transporter permease [Candidatus Coatesbacteria bacterium]